jgi:hypothetical protein
MIRKISIKLLRIIGRVICLPFLLVFGFINIPFIIFLKWDGVEILAISWYEWCSLTEAKRLFLERDNDDEEDDESDEDEADNDNFPNVFSNNQPDIANNSTGISSYSNDLYNSPSYYFHPSNSHYITPID